MRRYRLILLPAMLLALSGATPVRAAPPPFRYCGMELGRNALADFVVRLKKAIDQDYAIARHPELFSDNFSIGYRGKWLYVPARDLVNFRKALSNKYDWDFIYKSLANGELGDVGWRGCILDDGKISFEADAHGRLSISGFDADRQWSWLRKPRRK
jgi:hypothetical protein